LRKSPQPTDGQSTVRRASHWRLWCHTYNLPLKLVKGNERSRLPPDLPAMAHGPEPRHFAVVGKCRAGVGFIPLVYGADSFARKGRGDLALVGAE
jgi:hypothetical protein